MLDCGQLCPIEGEICSHYARITLSMLLSKRLDMPVDTRLYSPLGTTMQEYVDVLVIYQCRPTTTFLAVCVVATNKAVYKCMQHFASVTALLNAEQY